MYVEETTQGITDVQKPLRSVPLHPKVPQTAIFCSDFPLLSKQGAGLQ